MCSQNVECKGNIFFLFYKILFLIESANSCNFYKCISQPAIAPITSISMGLAFSRHIAKNDRISIDHENISVYLLPNVSVFTKSTAAEAIRPITTYCITESIDFVYILSRYRLNMYMSRYISMNEGVTTAIVATIAPKMPATEKPTNVAELIPMGPGVACDIATISVNCDTVSQW